MCWTVSLLRHTAVQMPRAFNTYMSPASFLNLDAVWNWECAAVVLQWCESRTEAWIVRTLWREEKDQRCEVKPCLHVMTMEWGIKTVCNIAYCLMQSRCRQEALYGDGLKFLSRTHTCVFFSTLVCKSLYFWQTSRTRFFLSFLWFVLFQNDEFINTVWLTTIIQIFFFFFLWQMKLSSSPLLPCSLAKENYVVINGV